MRERGYPAPLLIDQGGKDQFLDLLKPEALVAAAAERRQPLQFRMIEGYDHSYFYVASVMRGPCAVARGAPVTREPDRTSRVGDANQDDRGDVRMSIIARRALAAALLAALAGPALAQEGDAVAGEKVFKKCAVCHAVEPDGPAKPGPNLHDVVGGPPERSRASNTPTRC